MQAGVTGKIHKSVYYVLGRGRKTAGKDINRSGEGQTDKHGKFRDTKLLRHNTRSIMNNNVS